MRPAAADTFRALRAIGAIDAGVAHLDQHFAGFRLRQRTFGQREHVGRAGFARGDVAHGGGKRAGDRHESSVGGSADDSSRWRERGRIAAHRRRIGRMPSAAVTESEVPNKGTMKSAIRQGARPQRTWSVGRARSGGRFRRELSSDSDSVTKLSANSAKGRASSRRLRITTSRPRSCALRAPGRRCPRSRWAEPRSATTRRSPARAARLAGALVAGGLRRGDRVALVSRNVPAYIEALFGCWWAGLVAVPVNAKLHPKELAFVLADSGARWRLRRIELARGDRIPGATARRSRPRRRARRRGLRRGLSGASPVAELGRVRAGRSGVAVLHERHDRPAEGRGDLARQSPRDERCFVASVESVAPGDALLHPAPLSHGSGLYLLPHVAAGAVNVVPESGGFDAGRDLRAPRRVGPCALLRARRRWSSGSSQSPALGNARLDRLKCIVYGGGPMYVADAKAAFAALGPRLAQIYGQGESPMTITAMNRALIADAIARGDDARLGSVGIAQTRHRGAHRRRATTGAARAAKRRGPGAGTDGDARLLEESRRHAGARCANGWLHTGDVGSARCRRLPDAQGSVEGSHHQRRLEHLSARSGGGAAARIPTSPRSRSSAARTPSGARRSSRASSCAAAARPTASAQRSLERALDALCLEHIARFKRPKAYVFLAELPKNNTGKVLKTELRQRRAPRDPRR